MTGEPITVYGRKRCRRNAPTRNLDTFDPNRKQVYNAYNLEFRARPGGGAQLFGGFAFERQRTTNCTAPDNPNTLRFCDDQPGRGYSVPFKKQFKLAGSYPLPWGILVQRVVPEQQSRGDQRRASGHGHHPRHDRLSGELPGAVPGRRGLSCRRPYGTGHADHSARADVDRAHRADQPARSQGAEDVPVRPRDSAAEFEMFNINNSDAIISYQSTNTLLAAYLRAEQHHAAAHDRRRRDRSLVVRLGPASR